MTKTDIKRSRINAMNNIVQLLQSEIPKFIREFSANVGFEDVQAQASVSYISHVDYIEYMATYDCYLGNVWLLPDGITCTIDKPVLDASEKRELTSLRNEIEKYTKLCTSGIITDEQYSNIVNNSSLFDMDRYLELSERFNNNDKTSVYFSVNAVENVESIISTMEKITGKKFEGEKVITLTTN